MEFEFCMQDPSDPGTRYLYEAIVAAAAEATTWRGMYAFASRGGVNQLVEDPVVQRFMERGGVVDLIVGIDAVTNVAALERMQELAGRHPGFRPRVFWNSTSGLFHPKISHFGYADGTGCLIVGSGNLTPGGLMHNFEGYSVVNSVAEEALDLSSLDEFLERHTDAIRPIDQQALDRAAFNIIRAVAGTPRPRPPAAPGGRRPGVPAAAPRAAAAVLDQVLIAQAPAAGGRWAQVHFNGDVIERYFRLTNLDAQRVYLTQVRQDGIRGDEEVRPCVFSTANSNHKIEIGAARGIAYPGAGRPLLIFRERQVRVFDYMLVMPGQPGHSNVSAFLALLPSIGRGTHRSITSLNALAEAWPDCPLLASTPTSIMEL
jgi:hypothetical protein